MLLSTRTPGVRPWVLATLVTVLAAAVLAPWLSPVQWRGAGVDAVRAVRDGRPFTQPERAGYLILGMAADAVLPTESSRDLNVLGFACGILGTLAVARCRSALARGGVPLDRHLEPLTSALALLACGPLLTRVPSADVAGVEIVLGAAAAGLAWTRRLPRALALFGLLLFISSRTILFLPVLLAAPRLPGDLRAGLPALVPWLVYAVLVRPGLHTASDPLAATDVVSDGIALAIGFGGVAAMAGVGMLVGIARGGHHRRFVAGFLAVLLLVVIILVPRAGWLESSVLLAPWLAVLAGGGVGSLRRAAARVARVSLGPAAAAAGILVLSVNLGLSARHLASPVWRQAERFPTLTHDLGQAMVGQLKLAADWNHRKLYALATNFRLKPWSLLPGVPLPERPLGPGARAALDAAVREGDVILLRRFRYAIVLSASPAGVAQLLKPEGEPAGGRVANFSNVLLLEQIDAILTGGRRPGGLVSARLHWRATWPGGVPPPGPGGGPAHSLKVAMSVVDAGGRVRLDLTHWLAHGLLPLTEIGDRRFKEILVFQLPPECGPGDYGIEVAVYEPVAGEPAALDLELGTFRQRRYAVQTGVTPPGVTPHSVRATSFRLQLP